MSKTKNLLEIMQDHAAEIIKDGLSFPLEAPLRVVCGFVETGTGALSIDQKLLPKHWEPKGEYVEVFSGKDHTYTEKIIRKSDVKRHIDNGWRITRLSKLSPSMVNKKWIHAIIAMENE